MPCCDQHTQLTANLPAQPPEGHHLHWLLGISTVPLPAPYPHPRGFAGQLSQSFPTTRLLLGPVSGTSFLRLLWANPNPGPDTLAEGAGSALGVVSWVPPHLGAVSHLCGWLWTGLGLQWTVLTLTWQPEPTEEGEGTLDNKAKAKATPAQCPTGI